MSKLLITDSKITDIADAIRAKTGAAAGTTYTLPQMVSAIAGIHTGIELTASDEGKVVSNGALEPQTSRSVASNGTYDTTTNNEVVVNVGNTYGSEDIGKVVTANGLSSQTSRSVAANGTYDTTTNNEVVVSVPNTYSASDEGKVVSNGALVAQTAHAAVTQNGTIDTTLNNSVVVNVPSGGSGGSTEWEVLQNPNYTYRYNPNAFFRVFSKRSGGEFSLLLETKSNNRAGLEIAFEVNGLKAVKVDFDIQTDRPNFSGVSTSYYVALSKIAKTDMTNSNTYSKGSSGVDREVIELVRDNNKNHVTIIFTPDDFVPLTTLYLFFDLTAAGQQNSSSNQYNVSNIIISSLMVSTYDMSTNYPTVQTYEPTYSSLIGDWSDFSESLISNIDGYELSCVLTGYNAANNAYVEDGLIKLLARSAVNIYEVNLYESVICQMGNLPYTDDLDNGSLTAGGWKHLLSPLGNTYGLFWRNDNGTRKWMIYDTTNNWRDINVDWATNSQYLIGKEIGWYYNLKNVDDTTYHYADMYVNRVKFYEMRLSGINVGAGNYFIFGDTRSNACVVGASLESVKIYKGNIFAQQGS